jgi:hypothetical protein
MGFRKDKTTAAQTAANDAATITAALVSAGQVADAQGAADAAVLIFDALFERLAPVVEADNLVFAEQDAAAPAASPNRGASRPQGGGSSGGTIDAASARSTALTFGKFKGVTLGELEGMSASEGEKYGHTTKDGKGKTGLTYLEWLATNENNDYMAKRATAILDARKASSDTEVAA